MKTDDWVRMLAADAAPVDAGASGRHLNLAFALGTGVAAASTLWVLGARSFAADDLADPMLWWRWLFCAAVAAAAWRAFDRLGRPGHALVGWWPWAAAPAVLMGALAVAQLLAAEPAQRWALMVGHSAASCPWTIAALSLPTLAVTLWLMRRMAPTRPMAAGAAAGLLAGAAGALGYTLHCTELAAPFLLVWYSIGMALPMLAGALIGRWWLRW